MEEDRARYETHETRHAMTAWHWRANSSKSAFRFKTRSRSTGPLCPLVKEPRRCGVAAPAAELIDARRALGDELSGSTVLLLLPPQICCENAKRLAQARESSVLSLEPDKNDSEGTSDGSRLTGRGANKKFEEREGGRGGNIV